ncbi:MAG: bifunctional phosphoribosyl-AMP cyclohydrolase/phosphoribosyl-ATP diphosphatase HisIE [Xanthomonadales bacterium]|nr:bifunctional phosphoribosyl-AMP cyclohydrolase/phosphoribosyl-ATP diphosphatase HisIE [Xanthomonadales bacterium]
MITADFDPAALDWNKGAGLLPAIVQDANSGQVLMLGYMNLEALQHSLASGRVTFYSRSKQRLWTKGESSGHWLKLVQVQADCDSDTLLVLAQPQGPVCHSGTQTCFGDAIAPTLGFLAQLEQLVQARKGADPESSYTAKLYQKGTRRIAQKVGEEGLETALAAVAEGREELLGEAADLLYHLLVLLSDRGADLNAVVEVLQARHGK